MDHPLKNAVGCAKCAFLSECGGLPEQSPLFEWDCYSECMLNNCNPKDCDLTCPNNQWLFANRLAEIEGTFTFSASALKVPEVQLPSYVTKIHNGSGRLKNLSARVVTIPIRELLRKSGANVSCRFRKPEHVRRYFRLSTPTEYIISCISVDEHVEMVWNGLIYGRLAKEVARLKPAAIIVPNFSFFKDDVPRIHTLYNRKRICMAAHILSEAGCRVIVPLNALTLNDWEFWYELLQENPGMKYVAKEFQTGLSNPASAEQAIKHLSNLQERLGRSLHPVALGAGEYRAILNSHFANYTIVDSRPHMMAIKRRRAFYTSSGSYSEAFSPTAPNETIDELLAANLSERLEWFK